MINIIFVTNQRPLCEREWPAVPRSGEAFHYGRATYIVQNVTWEDQNGEPPKVFVYVIIEHRYEAWLTGKKEPRG